MVQGLQKQEKQQHRNKFEIGALRRSNIDGELTSPLRGRGCRELRWILSLDLSCGFCIGSCFETWVIAVDKNSVAGLCRVPEMGKLHADYV